MSVSSKSANTQFLRMMLYSRPIHPELVQVESRRVERHGDYEVESWLTAGGHVVRFQLGKRVLTEIVLENADHLPETGLVHALPCLGEKDFDLDEDAQLTLGIGYFTTVQTENLTENLYLSTLKEMQDFAAETGALAHEWETADGQPCLSLLDTQKYRREFHFQSYHLVGTGGLILRTQSIFEEPQL